MFLFVGVGCLVDEVEELVEFWGYYDFGAAVALSAKLAGVVGNGVVFAASGCGEARRVYAEVVLQYLHYRRCAECGEVPVVAYVGAGYGHIVGIAFHKHVVVPVVLYYLGNLAEGLHGALVHLVAAALEEHIVGQRYVYHALKHAHVHLVQLVARQGAGKVGGQSLLLLACTSCLMYLLDALISSTSFDMLTLP